MGQQPLENRHEGKGTAPSSEDGMLTAGKRKITIPLLTVYSSASPALWGLFRADPRNRT